MTTKKLNSLLSQWNLETSDTDHLAIVGKSDGDVYSNVKLSQLHGMVELFNVLWIAIYEVAENETS